MLKWLKGDTESETDMDDEIKLKSATYRRLYPNVTEEEIKDMERVYRLLKSKGTEGY
jgi:ribosomal protein L19E